MTQRARYLGLFVLLVLGPVVKADIPGTTGVDVSGQWIAIVSTPSGRIQGEAEFTQTGYAISGWLDLGDGRIPLSAVIYAGKFVITPQTEPRRIAAFDRFELNADHNHMKGTVFPGGGKIELKRYRPPRPFRQGPSLHSPAHN